MHPSEATLLALVHGELAPGAAAGVRAHLAACSACFAAASELQRLDGEIGALLVELDHPVPRLRPPAVAPRPHRLRRAAIAAATTLLAAGIAAAAVPGTSLHRWVQDRLEIARPRAAMAPTGRRTPADEQAAGGIEMPGSGTLTIAFTQPQAGGILTVAVAERPVVSLRSFGGQVAYQIGEGRIVVDNRRPAGRYALEVPPGLRRLTVMLGGRTIYARDGSQPGVGAQDTISLSNDAGQ